jgi:hypothetical protein
MGQVDVILHILHKWTLKVGDIAWVPHEGNLFGGAYKINDDPYLNIPTNIYGYNFPKETLYQINSL